MTGRHAGLDAARDAGPDVTPATAGAPGALRYLAGIDGGGTATRARLHDLAGRRLGDGVAGPSALGQGVEQAWRHVRQALANAFADAGLPVPQPAALALGVGLAGAGVAAQRAAFLQADPGHALCVLDTDATTQLLGAHAGGPGIVVAAGTGSVAAARDADGTQRRCGGWGFPVGDEGSGAWLGLRAMQAAQAALDGRGADGPLVRAVIAHAEAAIAHAEAAIAHAEAACMPEPAVALHPASIPASDPGSDRGSTAAALLAWCARANAGAVANAYAQLAPLVFAAADAGDAAAQALLQAAADELARLVAALQAGPTLLPVVASGSTGVRLAALWPAPLHARLRPPAGDSADGALRLLQASPGLARLLVQAGQPAQPVLPVQQPAQSAQRALPAQSTLPAQPAQPTQLTQRLQPPPPSPPPPLQPPPLQPQPPPPQPPPPQPPQPGSAATGSTPPAQPPGCGASAAVGDTDDARVDVIDITNPPPP